MDFEYLQQFIDPAVLVFIPVLYLIGLFLRQTPYIPIWTHPWILLILGVGGCLLFFGLDVMSVVQGVLVTGAALLVKDLIHKTINKPTTKDEDDKI